MAKRKPKPTLKIVRPSPISARDEVIKTIAEEILADISNPTWDRQAYQRALNKASRETYGKDVKLRNRDITILRRIGAIDSKATNRDILKALNKSGKATRMMAANMVLSNTNEGDAYGFKGYNPSRYVPTKITLDVSATKSGTLKVKTAKHHKGKVPDVNNKFTSGWHTYRSTRENEFGDETNPLKLYKTRAYTSQLRELRKRGIKLSASAARGLRSVTDQPDYSLVDEDLRLPRSKQQEKDVAQFHREYKRGMERLLRKAGGDMRKVKAIERRLNIENIAAKSTARAKAIRTKQAGKRLIQQQERAIEEMDGENQPSDLAFRLQIIYSSMGLSTATLSTATNDEVARMIIRGLEDAEGYVGRSQTVISSNNNAIKLIRSLAKLFTKNNAHLGAYIMNIMYRMVNLHDG